MDPASMSHSFLSREKEDSVQEDRNEMLEVGYHELRSKIATSLSLSCTSKMQRMRSCNLLAMEIGSYLVTFVGESLRTKEEERDVVCTKLSLTFQVEERGRDSLETSWNHERESVSRIFA